ncbi:MAG: polyisoprenoid-binding protein [Rhizobacter sp.]|nr:polyisoprenoid-binding protein [Rhizobacter sp.]
MKSLALFAALAGSAVFAAPAFAQQKLVPAQSEIVFISKQMGVPVEGRFKKFDAQVAFDPKKPETSKIAFTIDLGSASLGAAETEDELKKPGWFNSKAVPAATFTSSAIKASGPGKFDVTGKLNIKGSSQDVTVPVTLAQAGATTTANGSFAIKRLDYKIGEGEWSDTSMVANDVQVRFKLTLTGVPAL